ncbi:MAG: hypothetical protein RBR32_10340 [Bacteroidales bacterium]|nr:hypothetical protein [Bacteroidales bacterium]
MFWLRFEELFNLSEMSHPYWYPTEVTTQLYNQVFKSDNYSNFIRYCYYVDDFPGSPTYDIIDEKIIQQWRDRDGILISEILCHVGCNKVTHAISIIKVWYHEEDEICHVELLNEMITGNCDCIKQKGFFTMK